MKFVKYLELKVYRKIFFNVKCADNQERLRTTELDSIVWFKLEPISAPQNVDYLKSGKKWPKIINLVLLPGSTLNI